MVEHFPPPKNDEEHPLLKVETGGGDSGRPPSSLAAPGFNVACSRKRAWVDRVPELFSACWMSGMLLGIFIIIVYGLGTMGVIRRPPLFVVKCNESRPGSEVSFHYLVEDGVDLPFKKLSEYLSYMGTQYPGLHFNVVFLMVNENHNRYRRSPFPYYFKIQQNGGAINDLHMFRDFHLKYHNINITIMSLPKYMSMTPWRYKWKKIPLSNLIFYLRVYSVWKNGGIGMSLDTFSKQFNLRETENPAITEILRQHSNGIKLGEYSHALNKFDQEEQNEFGSLLYGIIQQILNETRAFINRSLIPSVNNTDSIPKQIIKTHRDKREVTEKNASVYSFELINANATTEHANSTNVTTLDAYRNTGRDLTINQNGVLLSMLDKRQPIGDKTNAVIGVDDSNRNKSKLKGPPEPVMPQILLFHDFSIFTDNVGPSYLSPEMVMQNSLYSINNENYYEQEQETMNPLNSPKRNASYLLTIALDGSFVAATSKQHPILGHIISTACQRMPPRYAIQDAILTQCPSMFSDSLYCNSIYIL